MENETTHTENTQESKQEAATDLPELSAENIEERIRAELAKVVGIDPDLLNTYVTFLGNVKTKEVEALLKSDKLSSFVLLLYLPRSHLFFLLLIAVYSG